MKTELLHRQVKGAAAEFLRGASSAAIIQQERLNSILRHNAGSEYGKARSFSTIGSIAEYQALIPLQTYDDLKSHLTIDLESRRFAACIEAARATVWTSGSTAPAKVIPITDMLVGEFEAAIRPWLDDIMQVYGLQGGSAYWVMAPRLHQAEASSCGNEDFAYLSPELGEALRHCMVVPEVHRGADFDIWARITLEALLARKDLMWLSFWSPSLLVGLLETVEASRREELFRQAWPNLRLVSCWADGWSKFYLPKLRALLPWVKVQPKGLLSTEAVVSIPLSNLEDGAAALAYQSHFYEFLHAENQPCLPSWEVSVGDRYEVVITTGAGLYRYRTGDLVRVEGFLGEAPLLRFLGREGEISDTHGEKLSAGFVESVFQQLQSALGVDVSGAYLVAEPGEGLTKYVLYLLRHPEAPEQEISTFLDACLSRNPHYDYCRAMRQLGQAQIKYAHRREELVSTIKQPVLRPPAAEINQVLGD